MHVLKCGACWQTFQVFDGFCVWARLASQSFADLEGQRQGDPFADHRGDPADSGGLRGAIHLTERDLFSF